MTEGIWRMIDTAPKDETRVLLFDIYQRDEGFSCFVGWYYDGKWRSVPGGFSKRPTHWAPLPDLP